MEQGGLDLGMSVRTVPVLLPIPAERPYSYAVPDGMVLAPGDYVQVPLGPRKVAAVVWDAPDEAEDVDPSKLRLVEAKFDCPPLPADMRRFVDWLADYTLSAPGMVLRGVLRVPTALEPESPLPGLRATGDEPSRMTAARARVMDALAEGGDEAWTRSGLAHAAGVTASVVSGLEKAGVLAPTLIAPQPVVADPIAGRPGAALEVEQQDAANRLRAAFERDAFAPILLDGITGSGKTEVYFEAIDEALAHGKQVLVLLPEIALTSAFMDRFQLRFGAKPAEWHSGITPRMREKVWRQVATGQVRIVAGARSSLFLPFAELGLIVVDEEHDSAYKQEDRVFYSARDMAVVRANIGGFPIVLASATPSVETRVNAEQGRYEHVRLDKRYSDAVLPTLSVVDMRRDPPERGRFLSPVLVQAVEAAVGRGEQALLFLNRRGYAPLTLCRVCGHRFGCPNCSAWLVEHRFRQMLACHHCGHTEPTPEHCPGCGTLDHLVACGPGVERLAEEVDATFPDARIIVLSSDLLGGVSRLRAELDAVRDGQVDIVIGTQLVAKGHNFPKMTCVGVVDADIGLANGDPRAAERTFQLLAQVTGRAGRSGGASVGLLQTYAPEHPVIQAIASGDREAFYDSEIAMRRQYGLPPFARLAALIVSATDKREADAHARKLRQAVPPGTTESGDVIILGPAEAPLAQVRGRWRYRLLVHAPRGFAMQEFLRAWMAVAPRERGNIRVHIDIDPQSFL